MSDEGEGGRMRQVYLLSLLAFLVQKYKYWRSFTDEGEGGRMRQVLSLLAFLVKSANADTPDCHSLSLYASSTSVFVLLYW